jgi:hypothetical protein
MTARLDEMVKAKREVSAEQAAAAEGRQIFYPDGTDRLGDPTPLSAKPSRNRTPHHLSAPAARQDGQHLETRGQPSRRRALLHQ